MPEYGGTSGGTLWLFSGADKFEAVVFLLLLPTDKICLSYLTSHHNRALKVAKDFGLIWSTFSLNKTRFGNRPYLPTGLRSRYCLQSADVDFLTNFGVKKLTSTDSSSASIR